MKNYLEFFIVGCVFFISAYIFQLNDVTYTELKESYELTISKDLKYPIKSPNYHQYKYLINSYWTLSDVYLIAEDMMYPFRRWSEKPGNALKFHKNYKAEKVHIKSLSTAERSTKSRALKAYFDAKRKNFRQTHLNDNYNVKLNQWLTVVKNLTQKKLF